MDGNVKKWDSDFFRVEAVISKNDSTFKLEHAIQLGKLKTSKLNGKKIIKLSELLGQFPVISIAPKEVYTLLAASKERRKTCDAVLSQFDKIYLTALIQYNALLKRRNQLLKDTANMRDLNLDLIKVLDQQIAEPARIIHDRRVVFINELAIIFAEIYKKISVDKEICTLQYQSQLFENNLTNMLFKHIESDFYKGRTSYGIHKDDILFKIHDKTLNPYASQGQLKSFVIAYKLALFNILKKNAQTMPLLLLDDIFDKIDAERTEALLKLLYGDNYGQIFITDADLKRIPKILSNTKINYNTVIIKEGKIDVS